MSTYIDNAKRLQYTCNVPSSCRPIPAASRLVMFEQKDKGDHDGI